MILSFIANVGITHEISFLRLLIRLSIIKWLIPGLAASCINNNKSFFGKTLIALETDICRVLPPVINTMFFFLNFIL